ncbi:MAG: PilN domain-containing protein [Phycisphaerales bacterium]|nr:PilN domain-containing protein [Phycisphaerales bacterium]
MKNPFQRGGGGGGSFLPEDYVARKVELRANLLCLSLFGVVMFGVVAAFFVTNRQWLSVRKEQEAITVEYTDQAAKIDQLKQLETQKASMIAKAEVTTALIEKVPRSVLMAELITRMPRDITLLDLELSSKRIKDVPAAAAKKGAPAQPKIKSIGGPGVVAQNPGGADAPKPEAVKVKPPRFEYRLKLTGVAKVNNDIADYMAGLQDCTLLAGVELKHIKTKTIDKVDLREFIIEATIRNDADARGIGPVKDPQQGAATKSAASIANAPEGVTPVEAATPVPADAPAAAEPQATPIPSEPPAAEPGAAAPSEPSPPATEPAVPPATEPSAPPAAEPQPQPAPAPPPGKE